MPAYVPFVLVLPWALLGAATLALWAVARRLAKVRELVAERGAQLTSVMSDVLTSKEVGIELEATLAALERTNAELADAWQMMDRITSSVDEYFYTYQLDADGSFQTLFETRGWERILGATPGDATDTAKADRIWQEAVHPDDRALYDAVDEPLRRGEAVEVEYRLRGLDGETRWIWVRERPRVTTDDHTVVDGVAADITARKHAEIDLGRALEELHDAYAEVEQARAEAERQARVDAVTNVYNRRHLSEVLAAGLDRLSDDGATGTLGVLLLDVDHFKAINDGYGHQSGDLVLREIARRVADAVRETDCVARWGGEEFAVLVPGVDGEDTLRRIGEAIRAAVSSVPIPVAGGVITVTASLGGACAGPALATPDALVHAADDALYAAKRGGRDQVRLAGELVPEALAGDEAAGAVSAA